MPDETFSLLRDAELRPRHGPVRIEPWSIPTSLWREGAELRWRAPVIDAGAETRGVELPEGVNAQQRVLEEFWQIGIAAMPYVMLGGPARIRERIEGLSDGWFHLVSQDYVPGDEIGQRVERFAQSWGPLLLCRHGSQLGHCWLCLSEFGRQEMGGLFQEHEPINGWCLRAVEALLLARIAGDLRDAQQPSSAHVHLLVAIEDAKFPGRERSARSILYGHRPKQFIAGLCTQWMEDGEVYLGLDWQGPVADLAIRTSSVFGVLAVQTATAISGTTGIWSCDSCGWPHFRQRAPKKGQGKFCKRAGCGVRASWRKSKRT